MDCFNKAYFQILEKVEGNTLFTYKDGTPIKHGDVVRYTGDKNKDITYTVVGGDLYKNKVQLEKNNGESDTNPSWIHAKISQVEKIS